MVDESSRHQGVATKLLSAAQEWASTVPAAYIPLANRRAGAFYLKAGYEDSATYFRKMLVSPQRWTG
jgi:GNAT superfamily N-acetyltransferase